MVRALRTLSRKTARRYRGTPAVWAASGAALVAEVTESRKKSPLARSTCITVAMPAAYSVKAEPMWLLMPTALGSWAKFSVSWVLIRSASMSVNTAPGPGLTLG